MIANRSAGSGETERLTLALVLALALHAVVITQLHFDWIDPAPDSTPPNLDVLLVDWASEKPPDEADFLAQANQTGGGIRAEPARPSAPPPAEPAGRPTPPERGPDAAPRDESPTQPVLAQQQPAPRTAPTETRPETERSLPDAGELLRQTRRLASTVPSPRAERLVLPERPRRKYITANTREHLYASYMRAWVAKVERVGNMNYPEAARRRKLEGSLVLSVDVLADGSIEHVRVMRSSGYDLLDEAAVRIVRLAAPYAELPPDIRAETDVLTITRTWQFSAGGRLR